jgi:hypothetical protein
MRPPTGSEKLTIDRQYASKYNHGSNGYHGYSLVIRPRGRSVLLNVSDVTDAPEELLQKKTKIGNLIWKPFVTFASFCYPLFGILKTSASSVVLLVETRSSPASQTIHNYVFRL